MTESTLQYRQADRDAERFLFLSVLLLMLLAGIFIWLIEYYQWPGIWRAVQSVLINVFTSTVGFFAAFTLLRQYNERTQRQLIDESLRARAAEISQRIDRLESSLSSEVRHAKDATLSVANWKEQFISLNDLSYEDLFSEAREVGLLVQSWERWVEERNRDLMDLVKRGGTFTLIVHDPENKNVIAASASRWKLRRMDQKSQVANTISQLQRIVPQDQLKIVKHNGIIWYCALRFVYDNPDDSVYIISPYAHADFAVNHIPAFVIKKSLLPQAAEFFELEWHRLVGSS